MPLTPDIQPDDLIIKERYALFLQRSQLKAAYPDLELIMSAAGNYRVLEQQIGVHQYWVKEHKGEDISYADAAVIFYNNKISQLPIYSSPAIRHRLSLIMPKRRKSA